MSVTGTETAAGSTTTPSHVANPFTGSTWYVNPDYTAEVATSVASASGTLAAQMTVVGQQSTGIWLDRIAAIYGGSGNSNRMSLQAQLANAVTRAARRSLSPSLSTTCPTATAPLSPPTVS